WNLERLLPSPCGHFRGAQDGPLHEERSEEAFDDPEVFPLRYGRAQRGGAAGLLTGPDQDPGGRTAQALGGPRTHPSRPPGRTDAPRVFLAKRRWRRGGFRAGEPPRSDSD